MIRILDFNLSTSSVASTVISFIIYTAYWVINTITSTVGFVTSSFSYNNSVSSLSGAFVSIGKSDRSANRVFF